MNILTYFEEKDIPFLRVPKCIRKVLGRDVAEVYALLREKRSWLVKNQLIRDHDEWFFYTSKELQDDFLAPNSSNFVRGLVDKLEEAGLIQTRVDKSTMPVKKYYRLIDSVYMKIAQQDAEERTKEIRKEYDKKQEELKSK